MQSSKFKIIILLAALGVILRVYIATLPGFKIDIDSFFAWAMRLSDVGVSNFYSQDVFTDYTPGYLYILYLLGSLNKLFSFSTEQFYFILKIPAILAEVSLGIFVYLFALQYKFSQKTSLIMASLVLFNPALIFNSSLWGQVDSVLTLFMVLAVYFLKQRRYVLSSVILALAFLIKPQTISLFPVFLLFILKIRNPKIATKVIMPALLTGLVLAFPFFLSDPLFGLLNKALATGQEYPYTSLYAFNFWGMIGVWLNDTDKWVYGLSYQAWGYLFFAVFWGLTSYIYFKKNTPLYTLSAIATLGFYFLPTRVHERYLYPALVFLILSAIELKSTKLLIGQILLSVFYLSSLYYVYIYYNNFYLHTPVAFFDENLYNLLGSNIKLLSGINTAIFLLIAGYILIKTNVKKNI